MKHEPVSGAPLPFNARPFARVAVLGAGSWGTALAVTLARAGVETRLWGRDPAVLRQINAGNSTPHLPGVTLPASLRAVKDMEGALTGAEAALIVVPSRSVRSVARQVAEYVPDGLPIAVCAKGIEAETGLLMTQVAEEELGKCPIGCVSGPTFAVETALGHPTAATVAFPFSYADRLRPQDSPAARLAVSLTTESFRAYVSDDLVAVEIGGAVKNVIAIACGMMTGAGFAENTRAALITRGLDEMKTLAEALGGRRETVTGLSGIGDLSLTCSSPTSRNMSLGQQLGQGLARAACFDGKPVVVEGEVNARSVTDLARSVGVSMPICETVRAILHDGADLGQAFAALWARPIEAEPRAMDLSFDHPATDKAIATLAERIS
ncbi:glycerol-3-phosphate dehydrogenase (NAD(P)(+)) (plasmid) [Dinoroseobacter shibae DFL 12 = DSM 16493]|jgi:glycerol-3-phosphate dehydrogenase (NAD(P)+)|uniref:Glycerol-3-phosphate dehydrogenase [NAD(P)+] n=1 Tax=Dinoroseobacter shibae (strain DSM 16493 / NCIMB 14021 / DFL 12) TaxID=398580 RepID=A8LTJ3_DINSH|nr:NAD(P)H-dependent glycerol-3-phosphate dehydrogenase [Dinoroseobacter shibae]ABV95560.1 glycerol-3-phosphate dehydrogenase (NAD(P)(+)) [Dinoroseobacter shibae DFL 12 = DSM 16493]URF48900.1 NAD(P)-dependent glycerol-3-phosphate dehydrogenase [Dinoroseobacter shibae]URF53212.1 NAD(P)-dependent glycerol-3-phosphate dehydrogenase [Dinoroseobacter shibae]